MSRLLLLILPGFLVQCVSGSRGLEDESVLTLSSQNLAPIEIGDQAPFFPNPAPWEDRQVFSHPLVQRWREYFAAQDRERFERFMARGQIYRTHVEKVLEEYGVPKSIYYLAIIESGFNTSALSRAKAAGPWQFMPSTGKHFGLKIDPYVDERRDPVRSTRAAAQYLKNLYGMFGSWYLAMAAYNAGENRIANAIAATGCHDYWELVDKKALPKETMHYVPKFLAALWVGEKEYQGQENHNPEFQVVPAHVPPFVPLADVASLVGISLSAIKFYNPHLLRSHTPSKSYRLWLPTTSQHTTESLQTLKSNVALAKAAAKRQIYRAKRGDTLARIARMFKVTIKDLRRENGPLSSSLRKGQEVYIPAIIRKLKRYKVKAGDNLHFLAERFGVTVDHIRRSNALRSSRIHPGQVLKI